MSETTNLKLFKHDNPSTNTNPFDVEQSLNENWDKIDTEIGNIRENINGNDTDITDLKSKVTDLETNLDTAQNNIDEIKQEQITQNKVIEANTTAIEENTRSIEQNTTDITKLQEDNAKLKAQIPTGTAAGEEISLSDSAEMELVDFGLQGNSYQEVEDGKNKAIIPDREETFNGMSINIKNGIINITGKSSVTYTSYRIVGSAELEAGKTYYLRLFGNKSGSASLRNDTESVWFPDSENNENQFTPTVGGTYNIQLGFGGGENQNWNARYSISETSNTDWVEGKEPKPTLENQSEVEAVGDSGSVEIVKSNKNILDFGNQTGNGISIDKNRIIIINPTASITASACNLLNNNFVSGKTLNFTFIANGTVVGEQNLQVLFRTNKNAYKVQQQYSSNNYSNDISKLKKTFADDEIINQIYIYATSSNTNLTIDVQVEISDEATEVVEHEGNTYQIPVQREMLANDYIDYANKKEVHSWKKVIKTSADDFNVTKDTTNQTFQFNCTVENGNLSSSVLCNMFKFWDKTWKNTGCFISYNSNFYALIKFGEYGFNEDLTIEQAKQKFADILAETSLVFYYTLTVAEELDLTEEQKQVLEQIVKDGTCKEVTHFYTTEDLKPTIELKYYKDLETLFKNQASMQETLNNVQAQILELGGK